MLSSTHAHVQYNSWNKTDRPFSPEFKLDRTKNKFIQVSPECEELLINTGLKIASVLCSDISGAPSLPKVFGNFTVSKIHFNKYFCYILHGRKIRWENSLQPLHHVIRQIIAQSPLLNLIIKNLHHLIGCNHEICKPYMAV